MVKLRYGDDCDIMIETIITTGTGRLIHKGKCMKEDYRKSINAMNDKFNLGVFRKKPFIQDTDLDWSK